MVMPFNLPLQEQETSAKDKQVPMPAQGELTPEQIRVGYKTEMSYQQRQKWLNTRTYSQSKPVIE